MRWQILLIYIFCRKAIRHGRNTLFQRKSIYNIKSKISALKIKFESNLLNLFFLFFLSGMKVREDSIPQVLSPYLFPIVSIVPLIIEIFSGSVTIFMKTTNFNKLLDRKFYTGRIKLYTVCKILEKAYIYTQNVASFKMATI